MRNAKVLLCATVFLAVMACAALKVSDLKDGTCVRVTVNMEDKPVATAVESGKHIPAMASKA